MQKRSFIHPQIELEGQTYRLTKDSPFLDDYPDLFDQEGICKGEKLNAQGLQVLVLSNRASILSIINRGAHYVVLPDSARQNVVDILRTENLKPDIEFVLAPKNDRTDLDKVQGILSVVRVAGDHFWAIKDPRKPKPVLPDDDGPIADQAALKSAVTAA